jgi:hypothetical protein
LCDAIHLMLDTKVCDRRVGRRKICRIRNGDGAHMAAKNACAGIE